jgi:hypothetical protein
MEDTFLKALLSIGFKLPGKNVLFSIQAELSSF